MKPGGILVVRVPPDWGPYEVRELHEALNALAGEWLGIKVLVVPGEGISVSGTPLP